MFCVKCGTKINDDDIFCTSCGNKVAAPHEVKKVVPEEVIKTVPSVNNNPVNDTNKTASIVLGIISIVTCCTMIIPIITGIIGMVFAFKARKVDRNFISGIIINIIGLIVAFITIVSTITFVVIGLGLGDNLRQDWCCSSSKYSNTCDINFELNLDNSYTMSDKKEIFVTPGTWDYEWLDSDNNGDKYLLTLDNTNYSAYVKDDNLTLFEYKNTNRPVLYCTAD